VKPGGEIVAEAEHEGQSGGSFIAREPKQVAEEARSYTGQYLAQLLKGVAARGTVETPKSKAPRTSRIARSQRLNSVTRYGKSRRTPILREAPLTHRAERCEY
jgi:hypothetical protein